jgi:hypothetical protein
MGSKYTKNVSKLILKLPNKQILKPLLLALTDII